MKRSIVALLVVPMLFGAAAPAQANDARIRFVLSLTLAKADYIAHRITTTDSSFAKFGERLSAIARREARVLTHVKPSTKAGGVARHQTIQGLKQLRMSGQLWVAAANAKGRRSTARLVVLATVRLNRGLFRLVVAAKALG